MKNDERKIVALEEEFPGLSGKAFNAARQKMLAVGESVLQSEGDSIIRIFPDGRREFVKRIQPPQVWKGGSKIKIR